MSDCTTMDCGNPTDTYLCGHCVRDLQQWIEKAWRLLPDLRVSIEKLDVVRKQGQEGGSGGKAGSNAPLSLDALQLRENLDSIDRSATEYAKDQFAAGIAWTIADWVTKAERVISGPEEERIDHVAIRERVKDVAPPMPTRELLPWLRANAGVHLTGQTIRHYAHRGYLRAIERDPLPTYYPHEVLTVFRERGKEAC